MTESTASSTCWPRFCSATRSARSPSRDRDAFGLDGDGFRWRDCHAGPAELAHARRERFNSIGSCSFFEPVEEIEALGILPL